MRKTNGKPAGIGQMILITKIAPCPLNPRKTFAKDALADLAASIRAAGIEVPLIVRPAKRRAGHFQLVDGERRYRAAKIVGLAEVPAIVRELTDAEVLQAMLVVDVQRTDIDDLERADGIHKLHTVHGVSLEDIASRIGRSVSTVRQLLRMRDLPRIVREACKDGDLHASTAQAIARVPGPLMREKVGRLVLMGCRYWNGKSPSDADVAKRRKEAQEPLTYRETRELIAEHCYRQLKQAPFSRQSLDLIPEAGNCDGCPKRAGNLKDDPEYAGVREDICTDVECYEAKVKAHAARMLAECTQSGRPVLAGDEAKDLFNEWNPTQLASNDWIDLARHCMEDRKNRSYDKLLGKTLADQITMAVDPAGTIHRLVPAPAARKALKDLGIKQYDAGGNDSWKREQAKQRAEDLVKKEAARRCMGLVADKAETVVNDSTGLVTTEMLRLIVEGLIDRIWDDVNRQVKIRRRLVLNKQERATSGGNRDLVVELVPTLGVPGLIGLLAELVAGQKALGYNDSSGAAKRYWEFFAIDPKAILADVRADRKAGSAPKTNATSACGEPWANVPLADFQHLLHLATIKVLKKKGLLSAGDIADFATRAEKKRLRADLLHAIEILRNEHKPGATERAAKRQQEEDADFDFAAKEAAATITRATFLIDLLQGKDVSAQGRALEKAALQTVGDLLDRAGKLDGAPKQRPFSVLRAVKGLGASAVEAIGDALIDADLCIDEKEAAHV